MDAVSSMNLELLPAIRSNPTAVFVVFLFFYSRIVMKARCGPASARFTIMIFRKEADQSFTAPRAPSGIGAQRPRNRALPPCPGRRVRLRIALDVCAKLGHRAESDRPLRKLGLDRAIGVESVGHAVDHARLEDGRLRGFGGCRLGLGLSHW